MTLDIIGRDEEIGVLSSFLTRTDAGLRALVLEGAAGIGKSTLWLAGVDAARDRGVRVLTARPAEAEQGLAYAGVGDLLNDVLDEVLPELPRPRRSALEIALLLEESPRDLDPRAVAVAMRNVLDVLAADGPVVLAVDDVQWLDPSSVAALAFALRRVGARSVLLLLTRRIGGQSSSIELEGAIESDDIERVRLDALSVGATQQLLHERLGRRFARAILLRIHEASGGNPFYSLEIARALNEDVDPTSPLPVPETLDELVSSRLHGLSDRTREALLLVAASGSPSSSLLLDAGVDSGALEPAFAAHVVERRGETIRFTHPLLASVLYRHTSPAERRRAHGALAEIADDPVERGRHLALSSDSPNRDIAGAVDEAAAIALGRGAPLVASELWEHALRLTPSGAEDERYRRTIHASRAHLAAGDVRRARTLARDLAAAAKAGQDRAEALVLLSDVEHAAGAGHERAVALRRDALREPALSKRLQSEIHRWLGWMIDVAEPAAAEVHVRASLQLAEELDDAGLRAAALGALAMIRFNGGNADGLALAEEAHDLAVAVGDPERRRVAAMCLAHVLVWSVQRDRARALLKSLYEELNESDERASAEALWYLSLLELRAGDFAAAADYARRTQEIHLQYAIEQHDQSPSYLLMLVAAHVGDLDRARKLAERMGGRWTRGLVELWDGKPAEAIEYFAAGAQAEAAVRDPTMRWFEGEYAAALLEVGRIDEAVALLDDWETDAARLGRAWALAHVKRCRGLVAAARGSIDEAQSLFKEAVEAHTEAEDPFSRARALLALGIVRRRARQKRAAREAIEAAVAGFEELGAAGWAAKGRSELGRIGGRTREEGLSPAERRVAELVAEGRTNREVAAALFLGESTVETHLTHVYAKLGVRSRTELARTLGAPS
jgi:DNA-binding CsgD family transcriptional regulator